MTLYLKALRSGGRSNHSFVDRDGLTGWDLPADGKPGAWKNAREQELNPHYTGLHLAPLEKAIYWFLDENYLAETYGEIVDGGDCVVTRRARLVKHLPVSHEDWSALALQWAQDVADLPAAFNFNAQISDAAPQAIRDIKNALAGREQDLGIGRHTAIDTAIMALRQYAAHSEEYYYNCESALAACEAARTLKGLQNRFNAAATAQFTAYRAAKAVEMAALAEFTRGKPPRAEVSKWLEGVQEKFMPDHVRVRTAVRQKQNADLLNTFGIKL